MKDKLLLIAQFESSQRELISVYHALIAQIGGIGFILTLAAGCTDAITYVTYGRGVTHMSGLSSLTSIALVEDNGLFVQDVVQLCSFVFGSVCSSLFVSHRKRFHPSKFYSYALVLNGFAILVAAALPTVDFFVCPFLSFAAGGLNASTSYYTAAYLRSSHVSGTLCDIGTELAVLMQGKYPWKLLSLSMMYMGYFIGGCLGTFLTNEYGDSPTLLLPAAILLLVGVWNYVYISVKPEFQVDTDVPLTSYDSLPKLFRYSPEESPLQMEPTLDTIIELSPSERSELYVKRPFSYHSMSSEDFNQQEEKEEEDMKLFDLLVKPIIAVDVSQTQAGEAVNKQDIVSLSLKLTTLLTKLQQSGHGAESYLNKDEFLALLK